MEYNICNGSNRWQISTSVKVVHEHFSLALAVLEIFNVKIREINNVGQGHDVQHSQWRDSMANTRLPIS